MFAYPRCDRYRSPRRGAPAVDQLLSVKPVIVQPCLEEPEGSSRFRGSDDLLNPRRGPEAESTHNMSKKNAKCVERKMKNQQWHLNSSRTISGISDTRDATGTPCFLSRAILERASPSPPSTIAPAWPIRLSGGADTPAM